MFDKFFKRRTKKVKPMESDNLLEDHQNFIFKLLILGYFEKNGIDGEGNKTLGSNSQNEEEKKWIEQTIEASGFDNNIEDVIISEWEEKRKRNNSLKPKEFINIFLSEFHNLKVEAFAPDFVKERNIQLLEAYHHIIKVIEKIQSWIDDESITKRIESDFRNKAGVKSTMFQCTTPFCIISLGCDKIGNYSLVYSLDYRIQEMISENFASTLLRRIHDFTSGDIEPFVKIGSLNTDCNAIFLELMEYATSEPYHNII